MSEENQKYYRRKLFALLHDPPLKALYQYKNGMGPWNQIDCLYLHQNELLNWWNPDAGKQADFIASGSDRASIIKGIYADARYENGQTQVEISHPISGQKRTVKIWDQLTEQQIATIEDRVLPYEAIRKEKDAKKAFWWFWRLYPQEIARETGIEETSALLLPADTRIPDCPVHTHNSIVSALAGTLYPQTWQFGKQTHPYLLIFTFSPIQEFVKSSRKLLDFWGGSYMLHYLSASLCWHVAKKYGPDAVITPSLWDQEIIDAFIRQVWWIRLLGQKWV